MKTSKIKNRYSLIIIPLLLLSFTTGDTKSEYILPVWASSLCCADIDLDGDEDIVVGHNYNAGTDWTGITVMLNDGNGYFEKDTFYLNGQHRTVIVENLNINEKTDLITQYWDGTLSYIGVMFDFLENQNNLDSINISYYADYIATGDINGDSYNDIVFAYNTEQQWGVLYNDGTGNFSEPEYTFVDYYPTDLHSNDLNNDGFDDIVIASEQVEIYYSSDDGFIYSPIGYGADQVAIADFDNDNDLDIVGNSGFGITTLIFYENIGQNQFNNYVLPSFQPNLGSLNVADFNNDQLPDLVLESGFELYVFYNQGEFVLSEPTIIPIDADYLIIHKFDFKDFDCNNFIDIAFTRQLGVYEPNLKLMFNDGNGNFVENPITKIPDYSILGKEQKLHCYPNPFKGSTQIWYKLENESSVKLNVYSSTGQLIRTIDEGPKSKGNHYIDFNASGLKNGIYFYSISINGKTTDSKKMTVIQ